MGGGIGIVLVAATDERVNGVAAACEGAGALVAHGGNVKGDFAALQCGEVHFFDSGAGRSGDQFLLDGESFAAPVSRQAGESAAAGKQQGGKTEGA